MSLCYQGDSAATHSLAKERILSVGALTPAIGTEWCRWEVHATVECGIGLVVLVKTQCKAALGF